MYNDKPTDPDRPINLTKDELPMKAKRFASHHFC
jgi:hypothetical protein